MITIIFGTFLLFLLLQSAGDNYGLSNAQRSMTIVICLSHMVLPADAFSGARLRKATNKGCPTNYVSVPALLPYTNKEFCVAKYYMTVSSGVAASHPTLAPVGSVSRDSAKSLCQALGAKYQLISNAQWQTIARNIESVGWNWSAGIAGSGVLNRGHSDNSPNYGLAASSDDNNACIGTGDTCSESVWHSQRRTFKLSNDQIIWDFAGNIWSWTSDDYASLGVNPAISASWQELKDLSVANKVLFSSAQASRGSAEGIGLIHGGSVGAVARGGHYGHGTGSGIFATSLGSAPSYAGSHIGFRCVYNP